MFRAIAALALASASAHSTTTLTSSVPWWERVTVTVTDDGQARSCHYESSRPTTSMQSCSVSSGDAATATNASASGSKDEFTHITFERRFSPGAKPEMAKLQPGEVLLGGRVMALAIDGAGAVRHCRIVAISGSVAPQYGCDEATAERFEASAGNARVRTEPREGYMTILVYGHSEHVV